MNNRIWACAEMVSCIIFEKKPVKEIFGATQWGEKQIKSGFKLALCYYGKIHQVMFL